MLAALPEHVGIVAPRIDVGGAALHGAFEQPLGPQQVLAVRGRQALVAQPPRVGELRRHGVATLHQTTARSEPHGENHDEGRAHRHGSGSPHGEGRGL